MCTLAGMAAVLVLLLNNIEVTHDRVILVLRGVFLRCGRKGS